MRLPFVSRKKHEALLDEHYELREQFEDYLRKERRRDREHHEEIQVLRQALFHKRRADEYEELLLKRTETLFSKPFTPNEMILQTLAEAQKEMTELTGIDNLELGKAGKSIDP